MKSCYSRNQLFTALIAASFLFMSCTTYGSIEDTIVKTFDVGPGGILILKSDMGSIEVCGKPGNDVKVEVIREVRTGSEKKAQDILKDFDIRFDQKNGDVIIEAEYRKKGWQRFWNNIGKYLRVKFIITVPERYNLDLDTKGGSISADSLVGDIEANASGGSLHFDRIEGNIQGSTSGGSIKIGEVVGDTRVHTSGGSIRIMRAEGPVDAHTSGGSITLEEVLGTIKAHTSEGSVKASITHQPNSECRLTTSGGSITVYLSEEIGMYVDAHTSGGRISADFPLAVKGEISKNELKAELNNGGPELYLRTSGGSIYLKKF